MNSSYTILQATTSTALTLHAGLATAEFHHKLTYVTTKITVNQFLSTGDIFTLGGTRTKIYFKTASMLKVVKKYSNKRHFRIIVTN